MAGGVLGLVARSDPLRNLALVQVGRPGPPVAFYDGRRRPPAVRSRRVALAGRRTAASGHLGRYRARRPDLPTSLAHMEAPTLPDPPEAPPWFLGDGLIGSVPAARTSGRRGRYPPSAPSEILDFLYGAGGALAALRRVRPATGRQASDPVLGVQAKCDSR